MRLRGVTVVLVAAGVLALVAPVAHAGLRVRDALTWTRPDASAVGFGPEIRVWCGPWSADAPAKSIHVRVGHRSLDGRPAMWELHAVVAHVKRRPVVRLPNSFVFDHPHGAQLFAVDGTDEVNSDTDPSAGRIRFDRVRCGPRMRIVLHIRARVGCETIDGAPLRVRGSFRASMSPG
jgi:hypothetical protein